MIKWFKKPYVIIGIGVGVGIVTVASSFIRQKNKTEEIIRTESNRVSRSIKIPKGLVGYVLGRGGNTIKNIREKTKTRINFDDAENEFTVATVTGSPEAVEEAIILMNEIMSNRHPIVTKEILLNKNISNSVWKHSDYIRQICDLTKAKIVFEFLPTKGKQAPLKIIIKGRKEEVKSAVELIDELVAEVQVDDGKQQMHVAGRALPDNLTLSTKCMGAQNMSCEKLIPSSSDGFQEIYVSAVCSPSKFWAQISGFKSIQLDKLVTEMTDYYDKEKNRDRFQLNDINEGDIVSAFFQEDKSWYRARVVKLISEDNREKKIAVFYLDFGDCATLPANLVYALNPDFLSIHFQAIECCLGDVEPINGDWTEEAIVEFEKLVYVAQWKMVMAKPIGKSPENDSGSPQLVQLMDTNTNTDINVAEELVIKGFGKRVKV